MAKRHGPTGTVTVLEGVAGVTQGVKRYTAGRTCQTPGCECVLSIYNPESLCNQCLNEPSYWGRKAGRKRERQ